MRKLTGGSAAMARTRRRTFAGIVYHVINRAARKAQIFSTEQDYDAFLQVVAEAKARYPMRILAYVVMPTHWHLLLWPTTDNDVSRFMHWLTTTHSRRWNVAHQKCGSGAVYQSRFKAIPVQDDIHLLWVWRYVERNALRANLVSRAEQWRWCSLSAEACRPRLLDAGPIRLPPNWCEIVNEPQSESEIEAIRGATHRGGSLGEAVWRDALASKAGVVARARGRPRGCQPDLRIT